jgi:hypothetical protein
LPLAGPGQLVDELDHARVLVGRHALAAEGDQLVGVGALAGAQADEGLDRLAAIGVGDADDGGLAHGRMAVEDVLDLARPHLEAGGVDLVLLAVDHVEPAVGVHEADVARVQRPARDRALALLRAAPSSRARPAGPR